MITKTGHDTFVKTGHDTFVKTVDEDDTDSERKQTAELTTKNERNRKLISVTGEFLPDERGANSAKGGGKLSRSETVTVRLDPKLRYLAELAARKQRRTVSSYIEWAIEKSLGEVVMSTRYEEGDSDVDVTTLADLAHQLWDVDPSERFAKLAITHESLLTHDEQVLWKHIEDSGLFAKGWVPPKKEGIHWQPGRPDWVWLRKIGFPLLRDNWDTFRKVANGELDRSHLPRFNG